MGLEHGDSKTQTTLYFALNFANLEFSISEECCYGLKRLTS